jgi:hypothetical protein
VFRIELGRGIRIGYDEIVRPIDLHAMPREEKQTNVICLEQIFELAELSVHADTSRVRTQNNMESVGLQLRGHVLGIIRRVLQHAAIAVSTVADHQRRHFPFHTQFDVLVFGHFTALFNNRLPPANPERPNSVLGEKPSPLIGAASTPHPPCAPFRGKGLLASP